jgi:hypothetical protein
MQPLYLLHDDNDLGKAQLGRGPRSSPGSHASRLSRYSTYDSSNIGAQAYHKRGEESSLWAGKDH